MSSKRRLEGYLLIDNRLSGGGLLEVPTLTCSHCQQQLIVNPDRTREREWCQKCDKYICDGCGLKKKLGADCVPMNKILDDVQVAAFRAEQKDKATIYLPS